MQYVRVALEAKPEHISVHMCINMFILYYVFIHMYVCYFFVVIRKVLNLLKKVSNFLFVFKLLKTVATIFVAFRIYFVNPGLRLK